MTHPTSQDTLSGVTRAPCDPFVWGRSPKGGFKTNVRSKTGRRWTDIYPSPSIYNIGLKGKQIALQPRVLLVTGLFTDTRYTPKGGALSLQPFYLSYKHFLYFRLVLFISSCNTLAWLFGFRWNGAVFALYRSNMCTKGVVEV
nr:MAG TPA: hypothetical protein [Caudoviricetes sp.]